MASNPLSRRTVQWGLVALMAVVLGAHEAIAAWQSEHAFMINASDSLPNWAFFVEKNKTPRRGDYVFFTPPRTPLLMKHFGEDHGPFGKQVLGIPGDLVTHRGADVLINGHIVARMKPLTRTGEPLHQGPTGKVPPACYYMGTPHKDGFDSRYSEIGFICAHAILGTGTPIL